MGCLDEDVEEGDIPSFTSTSKSNQPTREPERLAPPSSSMATPQVSGRIGTGPGGGAGGGGGSGSGGGRRSTVAGVRVETR